LEDTSNHQKTNAALLSALAGYVDTAGFLALFGLFTAHVTGNLVTAGAALAQRTGEGVTSRLVMIPIFMASVGATAFLSRSLKRRGKAPLPTLLALMTVALVVFGGAGVLLQPRARAADAWAVGVIGATGVLAMGIQNALMRDAFGTLAPTTVMTGNLTQFTIDLVDYALAPAPGGAEATLRRAEVGRRLGKSGVPLLGFVAGAALGAYLTSIVGFWSIALPAFVSGVMAVRAQRGRG
jgi:uncharacterized membrane protein YoaK (UPF0700 family)